MRDSKVIRVDKILEFVASMINRREEKKRESQVCQTMARIIIISHLDSQIIIRNPRFYLIVVMNTVKRKMSKRNKNCLKNKQNKGHLLSPPLWKYL